MPLGLTHSIVSSPDPFRDGFGVRVRVVESASGEAIEALRLDDALASSPAFEAAVRERLSLLGDFDHPGFSKPIRIERDPSAAGGLALVSRHPAGIRLSAVLESAAAHAERFDASAVATVAVSLTTAVAALQRRSKDLSVGTLAPERVLATDDARLVMTEYVFGPAIESLNLTREPLWRTYRVAVPQLAGRVRIDQRSDLVQVAMIVLALVAGRPIADDEFPASLPRLVADLFGAVPPEGFDAASFAALKGWLTRALQIDPRRSFRTATELESALAEWLPVDRLPADVAAGLRAQASAESVGSVRPIGAPVGLPAFGAAAHGSQPGFAVPLPIDSAGVREPTLVGGSEISPLAGSLEAVATAGNDPLAEAPIATPAGRRVPRRGSRAFSRWSPGLAWLLVAAALVAGGVMVARWRSAPPVGDGTLVVDSRPQGADVLIDDRRVGRTPSESTIGGGAHSVELRLGERRRVIPVVVVPDERFTVTFELRDLREIGQLEVRSDPTGAQVSINGRPQGEAPLLLDIRAGTHVVRVRQGTTTVQHPVTVQPGRLASLLVSLTAARSRPAAKGGETTPVRAPER